MAHYNKGIVFGKIISAKEDHMADKNHPDDPDRKAVCANLQIACPGDFGKVNVFGKVMQEAAAMQFLQEENAGKILRLEGFFAQYKDRTGVIKSNYNVLSWMPCGAKDEKDLRAVFILVGRIDDVLCGQDGETIVVLTTEREFKGRQYRSSFQLYAAEGLEFVPGGEYRIKGELRTIEDRFGDAVSVRPLILEARKTDATVTPEVAEDEIAF